MRVLMLGWEFPPHISGGLGTACHGLTVAKTRLCVDILFLLPMANGTAPSGGASGGVSAPGAERQAVGKLSFEAVPSAWVNPYATNAQRGGSTPAAASGAACVVTERERLKLLGTGDIGGYDGNLIERIEQYAARSLELTGDLAFDVIHAHDWVTYPAGVAIARRTGKPLICHLHASEFDRSGEAINARLYEIERRGMEAATAVVAVSRRTARTITERYGIPAGKVRVIYNGIEPKGMPESRPVREDGRKTVLFLGRITMQKGLEYFIRAAARILEIRDDVGFLVAGWGDQAPYMIDWVARMGLSRHIRFAGFLRGAAVDQAYRRADVFVMPSVSEPFGLAALEAIQHGVPVILSKSSGAAEVLPNGTLKVDFWDVEQMADKILSVLQRPALGDILRRRALDELQALTWDEAAKSCLVVYRQHVMT